MTTKLRLKTKNDVNPFNKYTTHDLKRKEISKYVKVDSLVNGEDAFFSLTRNKYIIMFLLIATIIGLIWSINYYTNYGRNGEGLTLYLFSLISVIILLISFYVFTKIPNIYFDNISSGYIDQNRIDTELQDKSKTEFVKEYNDLIDSYNIVNSTGIPNTEKIDLAKDNRDNIKAKLNNQILDKGRKAYDLKLETTDIRPHISEDGSYKVSIYQYMPVS